MATKGFPMKHKQKYGTGGIPQHGLVLTVTAGDDSKFIGLLNAGFMIKTRIGEPVKTLLCDRLGLDQSYFDERIQTLFLNGKPVDDPATAVVQDGATLALSAAMPGLVGATFRKGGRYRWMRGSISHIDDSDVTAGKTGWVTVKLFNMILKELGPYFLEAGVWLKGKTIQSFFTDRIGSLAGNIQSVFWNGQEIVPETILGFEWPDEQVYIKLVSDLPTQQVSNQK
jgi:hypothetical protein